MSDTADPSSRLARGRKVAALFEEAVEQPPGPDRDAWLRARCGDDESLLAQVIALLEANERAGGFLGESDTADDTSTADAASRTTVNADVQPGSILGPYKLLQRLGEGGFGEVFLAEQDEPVRRQVALKIIKPGMDSREVMARFEAERQALAMMDHPNIATVLDAGSTETGRPYFVMELVRGIAITKFCDREQLTTETRLTLFEQVCSAIQHAHQKGVIHRDIKPSNVLVTSYDGVPVPKVIDFGIAKAMQQKLTKKTLFTRFEQFIGTPAYMSPEQAEHSGLDLDTRADVYALGVLLYELLVGRTPFDPREWAKAGFDEIRRRIREDAPKKPSTRLAALSDNDRTEVAQHRSSNPDRLSRLVHGDLDWIVMKALEKDRRRRYESPSAFARDIARFRAHESIEARPPSTRYRMTQFFRRHRLPCLAGLFSLASLLVGLAVSLYGLGEANQGRIEAETNLEIAEQNEAEARAQSQRADREAAAVRRLLYPNILEAATEALRDGKRSRAAELLATCPESERGWEWRRLHRALIAPSHRYASPQSPTSVRDVRLSPSGDTILAAFEDGSLQMWDSTTRQPLASITGHAGPVFRATFNPSGDEILSIGQDNTLRITAATTGKTRDQITRTESFRIIAFSEHGNPLLAGETNGRITLWSNRFNEPLAVMEDRVLGLSCLAVDGETGLAAAGSRAGATAVWDSTGIRLWETPANGTGLSTLQFSPDGAVLATGDEFGNIQLYAAEGGRSLGEWHGHRRAVTAIAYSPDGQTLASAGQEGGVSLRDITSGREVGFFVGDETGIRTLVFSPDGRNLAIGGENGAVTTYNLDSIATPGIFYGHADMVFETALSPDGETVVSASRDGSLRFWDRATGVELRRIRSQADAILSVDISADGQWIATRGDDAVLRVRRFDTGALAWQKPVDTRVRHVRFHPKAPVLAAGAARDENSHPDEEPIIAIWDISQQQESLRLSGHRGEVLRLAFNPDGTRLASTSIHSGGSKDGRVIVWDLKNGTLETALQPSKDAVSHAVAWSPTSDRLYTGHGDGRVGFWTPDGMNERIVYAHGEPVGALCVSADGTTLATGAWYSEEMKLWNAVSGELRATTPTGIPGLSDLHNDPVGDGWIVCGLDGGLIRWHADLPATNGFHQQRTVALAARSALLNEDLLLSGGGDPSAFANALDTLVRDYRQVWRLADRSEDFPHGADELAATSLQTIAEEYLRSDLFEEAYIAMTRSLDLAPTSLRENQLRWVEEAQALGEDMEGNASPEELVDCAGVYHQRKISQRGGILIYRDLDLEEEWPLKRLGADTFQLANDATIRLHFVRPQPDARPDAVRYEAFSGRRTNSPRSGVSR